MSRHRPLLPSGSRLHGAIAVGLTVLALNLSLAGCSVRGDDKKASNNSHLTSEAVGALTDAENPSLFRLNVGAIETLVASLGHPWTTDHLSVQQALLPGPELIRTTFRQPAGLLVVYSKRSANAVGFQLVSGRPGACGSVEHFEDALEILGRGLGLPRLKIDEQRALESAWMNNARAVIPTGGALIETSTDGCKFALAFEKVPGPIRPSSEQPGPFIIAAIND